MGDAPTPNSNQAPATGSTLLQSLREALPVSATRSPRDGRAGVEVAIGSHHVDIANGVLERLGYHQFQIERGRVVYLARSKGSWHRLILDVDRSVAILDRLRSPIRRRTGLVVALVGPDGAGKGTVIEDLGNGQLPLSVRRLYFGTGSASASPGSGSSPAKPRAAQPAPSVFRETAFVARKLVRSARLLMTAYASARRGEIVLCDRHPVELLAIRPARHSPIARFVQRWGIRLLPRPDVTVVLDAPGEVLFHRKGEHSIEQLDRWREAFRTRLAGPQTVVVSSSQDQTATVAGVSGVIWEALARRHGW